jgi:HK97 gp10 family phage protein
MADGIEFSITGLDPVLAKMRSVKQDIRKKGGRFALRKAANLVAAAAKQNSASINDPTTGRSIADNIALRFSTRTFKRTGDLMFRIGVLHGAVLPKPGEEADTGAGGPTPHWRLIEFGTENMPANPFMRRSLSDNINAVISAFVTNYDKALDRAIRRAAKVAPQGG